MSSMRNAVQRRNHKERAQPLERQKWGLLEKHKDYTLRARDHNEKKRRIKALKQKVAEHNPDEFAFGMVNSRTQNGIRIKDRGKDNGTDGPLSMDVAKLLKTQDAGYLRTVLAQVKSQRARAIEDAAAAGIAISSGGEGLGRHILFEELDNDGIEEVAPATEEDEVLELPDGSESEVQQMDYEVNLSDDEEPDGALDVEMEEKDMSPEERRRHRRRQRHNAMLRRKVEALTKQEAELSRALDVLDKQRAKMNRTIGGVNKNGVKFKIRERKR